MKKERFGAYFHIPFCDTKCTYCDFYSITNHSQSEKFYRAIEKEIVLYFNENTLDKNLTSIFFGGGTPSLADPNDLGNLIKVLDHLCPKTADAEITLEANPGTLNDDKLLGLLENGFNRISMGVQSFFDDDLKFLQRIHSVETAKQAVYSAKQKGFNNISIDLIFGLPNQTLKRWKKNLEEAVCLPITHISCYNLIVEENTPLFNQVKSGKVNVLGDTENEELYELTIDFLKQEGFYQYEVSNFSKPDFESLHNSTYWSFDNYLAFGPSAHGFIGNQRFQNVRNLTMYLKMIEQNQLPILQKDMITGETLVNEKLMLSVRTLEGVQIAEIWQLLDSEKKEQLKKQLNQLQSDGMLQWNDQKISPTSLGIRFADTLAEQLFI